MELGSIREIYLEILRRTILQRKTSSDIFISLQLTENGRPTYFISQKHIKLHRNDVNFVPIEITLNKARRNNVEFWPKNYIEKVRGINMEIR